MTFRHWRVLTAVAVAIACAACTPNAVRSGVTASVTAVRTDLAREVLPTMAEVRDSIRQNHGGVVIGRVTASREAPGAADPRGVPIVKGTPGYEPATDFEVEVMKQLGGASLPPTFRLHQPWAPGVTYDSLPQINVGSTYLLAVRPFTFGAPTDDPSAYVVVGLEAVWEVGSNGDTLSWAGKPARSPAKYPTGVTQAELVAELVS